MKHIFIINANLGGVYDAEKIRNQLKSREDFEYLVFNTEYAGHERVLAEQMEDLFKDEKIRIYSCGGTGTFYNVLNGIHNLDRTEIAFLPCGVSCDFLKVFGPKRRYFRNIENLIEGEVYPVDVIQTNQMRVMNNMILGAGVKGLKSVEHIRSVNKIFEPMAYLGTGVTSIFFDPVKEYELEIDGVDYSGRYKQIFILNGCCCGSKYYPLPASNPFDGYLNFLLLNEMKSIQFIKLLKHYKVGNTEELEKCGTILAAKKFSVKAKTNELLTINCDGEFEQGQIVEGEVLEHKLKFIVPKEVFRNE
ncbi:MAG: diacylglycerol kinase family protein [Lachnospiraceae bacterium]|nr:diacylglycerol kinase family protein [Lachnospiraceae bacterium]